MEKKTGIELIAEERRRQIEVEGWSDRHDSQHDDDELAIAAGCYALTPTYTRGIRAGHIIPKRWPWEEKWWKPTPNDRIRELQKAGALIAAEIDRLQALSTDK
jgi:hypothetical protein